MPLPLRADGEFLPPARTAASQYGAAILGRHTGEEAVRFGASPVVRLKSTFRHLSGSGTIIADVGCWMSDVGCCGVCMTAPGLEALGPAGSGAGVAAEISMPGSIGSGSHS